MSIMIVQYETKGRLGKDRDSHWLRENWTREDQRDERERRLFNSSQETRDFILGNKEREQNSSGRKDRLSSSPLSRLLVSREQVRELKQQDKGLTWIPHRCRSSRLLLLAYFARE
jgi:hypothetical protein